MWNAHNLIKIHHIKGIFICITHFYSAIVIPYTHFNCRIWQSAANLFDAEKNESTCPQHKFMQKSKFKWMERLQPPADKRISLEINQWNKIYHKFCVSLSFSSLTEFILSLFSPTGAILDRKLPDNIMHACARNENVVRGWWIMQRWKKL